MECIYDVNLINRSPQLDLRQETEKIANVIRETLDLRPEATRCDVIQIDQHRLVLSVDETGVFWHGVIGRKIAIDHRMQHYRSPDHLSQDVSLDDAVAVRAIARRSRPCGQVARLRQRIRTLVDDLSWRSPRSCHHRDRIFWSCLSRLRPVATDTKRRGGPF